MAITEKASDSPKSRTYVEITEHVKSALRENDGLLPLFGFDHLESQGSVKRIEAGFGQLISLNQYCS